MELIDNKISDTVQAVIEADHVSCHDLGDLMAALEGRQDVENIKKLHEGFSEQFPETAANYLYGCAIIGELAREVGKQESGHATMGVSMYWNNPIGAIAKFYLESTNQERPVLG